MIYPTVNINCFDENGDVVFTLSITTIEWVDLLKFIEDGMVWPTKSNWLEGIKRGIEAVMSGYHDRRTFTIKATLLK